jgi:hypothetical protein
LSTGVAESKRTSERTPDFTIVIHDALIAALADDFSFLVTSAGSVVAEVVRRDDDD